MHEKQEISRNVVPVFARQGLENAIPKYALPEGEMRPDTAYQLIHDELMIDGNARLNLATFVTTWMEPQASRLMSETFEKNMIDKDEYPQTAEIESRCVNILSRLWNSPDGESAVGTSTIGSSEAAMLGGMALKWRWRERMRAQGKPTDKPNLVMGINVQVCWDKFVKYWDVEPRFVPMAGDRFHLGVEEALELCDENTIGVVVILGSTFDGSYEPVKEMADALDDLQDRTGLDTPIHVDGASGGFVAPFLQPDLEWDFRVPRVASINTSGHKYGLVYPGVGWIVWRNHAALPEDLVFKVNYLGGEMPTFAINFSRPGNQVVAQYYNFLRLGRDGYTRIHTASQETARALSAHLHELDAFDLITDGSDLPVFAFSVTKEMQERFTVFDLSERLRDRGWLVPAYTFPENREDLAVLRVVVKEGFSRDLAEMLLADVKRHLDYFAKREAGAAQARHSGFHH